MYNPPCYFWNFLSFLATFLIEVVNVRYRNNNNKTKKFFLKTDCRKHTGFCGIAKTVWMKKIQNNVYNYGKTETSDLCSANKTKNSCLL